MECVYGGNKSCWICEGIKQNTARPVRPELNETAKRPPHLHLPVIIKEREEQEQGLDLSVCEGKYVLIVNLVRELNTAH